MAKKQHEEVNTEGWKDTYGDMVTLLLCFFVLLYSMSSVNSEKWEQFVKAFTNPGEDTAQVVLTPSDERGDHLVSGDSPEDSPNLDPSEIYPSSFEELAEAIQQYVEQNNMQDFIEVEGEDGVVYIRFQNSLFFLPDKSDLLPDAKPSLEFLGTSLKRLEEDIWLISISGHTAHVEGGSVSRDWLLSGERAGQIALYFEDTAGLDPLLLRPIGFGENYPIESNDTEAGRARNRRVEMVIISRDSSLAQNETVAGAVSGLFDHSSTAADDTPLPDALMDLHDPSRMGEGEPENAGDTAEGDEPAASGPSEPAASEPGGPPAGASQPGEGEPAAEG